MAWFGEITKFSQSNDTWKVGVDYYDDTNPTSRIPRLLEFPLSVTKQEVVAAIKAKGVEVMRVATFNTEGVVGFRVPIP